MWVHMLDSDLKQERLTTEAANLDGMPLVRVSGEIDLYNVSVFEQSMMQAVDKGTRAVIADLSHVLYLDSSGLSALITAYKVLDARNARLFVIAPPSRYAIRRVLEITRIDQFIFVRDDLDAVRSELRESLAV